MHRPRSLVSLAAFALTLPLLAHAAPAAAETGLHVDDQGRLTHADGTDLIMRGVSHPHAWFTDRTPTALADIAGLGANTVRVVLSSGDRWDRTDQGQIQDLVAQCADLGLVCVLEVHDTTGYGEEPEAATLDQAVDYWLDVQSALDGAEDHIIVNIGNEPYGNDEATNQYWAADTSDAIVRLREAGLDHMLVVDAPNWGQDWQGSMRESASEVADVDPHDNTVFSIHMYGVYEQESTVVDYLEHFTDAGLPLIIGEFGHDHSDGDPDEDAIMAHADRLGLGYIGWSWSGNSGGVEYLDIVEDFDADRITEWGERLFHGPNGIATGG